MKTPPTTRKSTEKIRDTANTVQIFDCISVSDVPNVEGYTRESLPTPVLANRHSRPASRPRDLQPLKKESRYEIRNLCTL